MRLARRPQWLRRRNAVGATTGEDAATATIETVKGVTTATTDTDQITRDRMRTAGDPAAARGPLPRAWNASYMGITTER